MSEAKIQFDVLTPFGIVARGECDMFVAPASTGEYGFLPGHTPFLAALGTGVARARIGENAEQKIFLAGGFVEFLDNRILILAEAGETSDKIDIERARAALTRSRERLENPEGESACEIARDRRLARRAYDRAKARLYAAGELSAASSGH